VDYPVHYWEIISTVAPYRLPDLDPLEFLAAIWVTMFDRVSLSHFSTNRVDFFNDLKPFPCSLSVNFFRIFTHLVSEIFGLNCSGSV